MKFVSDLGSLVAELSLAQEIISAKHTVSIFSSILIQADSGNTLTVRSSDMQISFSSSIVANVEQPGEALVFCGRLLSLLKSLKATNVLFELKDGRLLVKPQGTRLRVEVNTLPADKFPKMVEAADSDFFELPQHLFLRMIQNTIFAISHDESRYFLNGVFFSRQEGEMVMVATDAKRLSLYRASNIECSDFDGVIVPPKILNFVNRLCHGEGMMTIALAERRIFVNINNHSLSSTLIEGKYPNYQRIIPTDKGQLVIFDRNQLFEAVKRVAIMSEQGSRCINLQVENNLLRLSSSATDYGVTEEELECEYLGEPINLSLTSNSLLEPLRVMDSGAVELDFTSVRNPVLLRSPAESELLHLFMAVRDDD